MILTPSTTKACRICSKPFQPFNTTQVVCGLACARKVPIVARKAERADRKATKERINALRPISYWRKQAQQAFNQWIRMRDADQPCISCGTKDATQWHAGHYLTTGARPELRFDPLNVHKQCSQCNDYLSGNLVPYRINLIKRVGLAVVEALEGPHPSQHLSADDLKALRNDYRARTKPMRTAA